ncbi:unnamed protein product [Phaeothamnion confervicola]
MSSNLMESHNKAVKRHFINLTNGIEAIPLLTAGSIQLAEIGFIRIQSSKCEASHFVGVLEDLDTTLLMNLAIGHLCVVYDFGSRGTQWPDGAVGVPRALWWGLAWISYVLARLWRLPHRPSPVVRGYNVAPAWDAEFRAIPKALRKRLVYFRRFVRCDRIHLYGVYCPTDHDGDTDRYAEMVTTLYGLRPDGGGIGEAAALAVGGGEDEGAWAAAQVREELPAGMHLFDPEAYAAVGRAAGAKKKLLLPPEEEEDSAFSHSPNDTALHQAT